MTATVDEATPLAKLSRDVTGLSPEALLLMAGAGPLPKHEAVTAGYGLMMTGLDTIEIHEYQGQWFAVWPHLLDRLRGHYGLQFETVHHQTMNVTGFGYHGATTDSLEPGDIIVPADEAGLERVPFGLEPTWSYFYDVAHPAAMSQARQWSNLATLMIGSGRPTVYLTKALAEFEADPDDEMPRYARRTAAQAVVCRIIVGPELSPDDDSQEWAALVGLSSSQVLSAGVSRAGSAQVDS